MQRLLVLLSLGLLVAVIGLWMSYSGLADEFERDKLARSREAREEEREPAADTGPAPRKLDLLEKRILDARDENDALKKKVSRLETQVAELTRIAATPRESAPGPPSFDGPTAGPGLPTEIKRDESGAFVITQEEMDYVRAVQARIDRERRIEGQTRNYMRRIDSLAARGEIQAIPDAKKADVEAVLRRFVTKNDDLVTTYVREPAPSVERLTDDERRTQLSSQREKFGEEAKRALGEILPREDIPSIAERVFTNPWGLRPRGFNR